MPQKNCTNGYRKILLEKDNSGKRILTELQILNEKNPGLKNPGFFLPKDEENELILLW